MRGIRFVELIANIRANIVAFFSISMFVCLGLGLFLGIGWGAVALRDAAQQAFEDGGVEDIQIQFPYGITASDLEQLRAVDGVSVAETGYASYAVMQDGNTSHVLKLQSMTSTINQPTSVTGNLPVERDEVALLSFWAEEQGIIIGDTVRLKHDATDESDADGMATLTSDTFTVTALVDHPMYLYSSSAGLGVSSMGSGSIDCVGFVAEDAFDASAFKGGYPCVYVRCDSLEGVSSFSDEYATKVAPIVGAIEGLGGILGDARYDEVHGEAQSKIEDAERQIADGEQQLAEGKDQIEKGEQQLAEGKERIEKGEEELVSSVQGSVAQQSAALQRLNDAYRQLTDGQAKYDAGMDEYNTAADAFNQARSQFNALGGDYALFTSLVGDAQRERSEFAPKLTTLREAYQQYQNDPTDENWEKVSASYDDALAGLKSLVSPFGQISGLSNSIGSTLGLPISIDDISGSDLVSAITPDTARSAIDRMQSVYDRASGTIDRITGTSITIGGVTLSLMDIPGGLEALSNKLLQTRAELESALARLEAGWDEYYQGKAQYDQGVADGQAKLAEGQKELADGKSALEEKTKELEDGKATLEEKATQLEDGKAQLEDAKEQFARLEEYEWVVLPRQSSGAVQGVQVVGGIMDSVKWAMASLFILVGLFVCYSAISRLVHEQIVQIGTKKALGFREGEIALGYLAFSGLAVVVGIVASVVLAFFVIQGIMNPTAAEQFCMPLYGPHISLLDILVVGGLEMVLILLSTWIAIHSLLRQQAIELLKGETTANAKERFYERTRMWQRMSLFSQTVVNNCVNDKRRVVGTLIGVVGCTALIVVAVTLLGNVSKSVQHHYDEVYSYDSLVYLAEESEEAANEVAMALYKRGVDSSPAFTRQLQARKEDGTRSVVRLMVPTNEDSFGKFYHVVSTSGEQAQVENGGLWVSAAYGEHMGAKVGDKVTLTEYTGKVHTFTIAGFFDYYLIRQEFVLSQREYREAFGTIPEPNVMLVNTDGADLDRIRDALVDVDGYESLVNDYKQSTHEYDVLEKMLRIVMFIYLGLSAAMAFMVLLNLDVMFVSEKKRELIVLMICGFSTKEAKAYIYRDSIVLTVLGVLLGVALGVAMGAVTVFALEPDAGYFIKGFNGTAALVGAVGASVFAAGVLVWALREIPRFDLTDINRF